MKPLFVLFGVLFLNAFVIAQDPSPDAVALQPADGELEKLPEGLPVGENGVPEGVDASKPDEEGEFPGGDAAEPADADGNKVEANEGVPVEAAPGDENKVAPEELAQTNFRASRRRSRPGRIFPSPFFPPRSFYPFSPYGYGNWIPCSFLFGPRGFRSGGFRSGGFRPSGFRSFGPIPRGWIWRRYGSYCWIGPRVFGGPGGFGGPRSFPRPFFG